MNRRKLIGLVGALVVAALGTVAVMKYTASDSPQQAAPAANAPAAPIKMQVLEVTQVIPKGTPASRVKDFVTVKTIDASAKQPETLASVEELATMTSVTNTDLLVGDQVSKLRFSSQESVSSAAIVDGSDDEFADLVGVWVSLPPLYALNGNLKPGVSRVAVFAQFEPLPGVGSDLSKDVAAQGLIAHKVPVLDVYPPYGVPAAPAANGQPAQAAPAPATIQVKLGLDAPTAQRVIFTQLKGTLYLGEEGLAVDESGTKVVERGNVFEPTQKATAKPKTPLKPGAVAPAELASAGGPTPIEPTPVAVGAPEVKPVSTPVGGPPAAAPVGIPANGPATPPTLSAPSIPPVSPVPAPSIPTPAVPAVPAP